MLSGSQVQKDLYSNHGRYLSLDYIQQLSNDLGRQIGLREKDWTYSLPESVLLDTHIVGIGRDGTTTHIRGEGYRESMSGTISFYDEAGQRLHTIYQAQAPEYGKSTFDARFSTQIDRVKKLLSAQPTPISYIGLADGAKDNWRFLAQHTEVSILDYWHVCEYLTLASKVASNSTYEQKQWSTEARQILKQEHKGAEKLLEQMNAFSQKSGFSKTAKEGLQKAITYFQNHIHQMEYDKYEQEKYPIGSGVTEAACKVVVKQRLSRSGMRWYIDKAQHVLNIRALDCSDGQWEQFWDRVDKFGFSPN